MSKGYLNLGDLRGVIADEVQRLLRESGISARVHVVIDHPKTAGQPHDVRIEVIDAGDRNLHDPEGAN